MPSLWVGSCYRWSYSPRHDSPAYGTTFWPGTVTRGSGPVVRAVLGPTSKPVGWHGPARVLGVGPIIARYHLRGHCTNKSFLCYMFFWCHFYNLRLRLWIWEVESCKKLIVPLCWWSDHCHCVVILFYLQNQAMGRPDPPGYAGRHGTKSARGPVLGPKARHAGRRGTARQARGPNRHGTLQHRSGSGPCRSGPARPGGHL